MESHRIGMVQQLLRDVERVTIGSDSQDRYRLASVYQMTIVAEAWFPPKPKSLSPHMTAKLRKKVSNTCPSCVKPAKMAEYIADAKRTLSEYKPKLVQWLKDNGATLQEGEKVDIHSLGKTVPNVKG